MTKEKAAEMAKILQAYSEGKIIQRFICQEWRNIIDFNYSDLGAQDIGNSFYKLRIKPESKYVPFTFEDRDLFKDKWIKYKTHKLIFKIISIHDSAIETTRLPWSTKYIWTYDELFEKFEFEDGSPCGKLIEE